MYLQELRQQNGIDRSAPYFQVCYDIVDATLNSWKKAHDAVAARRFKDTKPTFIDVDTHRYFTTLVKEALKDVDDRQVRWWGCNTYPSELLAYAVLERWLAVEQAHTK